MRRKLALAMALSMVLTSVPVNTLTGFAEEVVMVEDVAMEDSVEETAYAAEEIPQDFESQILDEGSVMTIDLGEENDENLNEESDGGSDTGSDMNSELSDESDALFGLEEIVIESVEEVEEPTYLAGYEEIEEEIQDVLGLSEDEEEESEEESETEEVLNMIIEEGIDLRNSIVVNEQTFPETITVGEEGYVVYEFIPTEPGSFRFNFNDVNPEDNDDAIPYGYLYKYSPDEGLWGAIGAGVDSNNGCLTGFSIRADRDDIHYIVLAPRKVTAFTAAVESSHIISEVTSYSYDVRPGDQVPMTPVISGTDSTGKLTYEWYYYSENSDSVEWIEEASGCSTYTRTNITENSYCYCEISSENSSLTETVYFYFYIDSGLAIDEDESVSEVKIYPEQTETLFVSASNDVEDAQITYQWYKYSYDSEEYEIMDGETSSSLTVSYEDVEDEEGLYRCDITDGYDICEFYASACQADLSDTLEIEEDEEGWYERELGDDIKLSVYAETTVGTLSYQWYSWRRGTEREEIKGENKSELVLTNLSNVHETYYQCVVSNGYMEKSVQMIVYVNGIEEDLEISEDDDSYWEDIRLREGESTTLTVNAVSHAGPVKYQWYVNDELIEGETSATLEIPSDHPMGIYEYNCVVTNDTDWDEAYFNVEITNIFVDFKEWNSGTAGESLELSVSAYSVTNDTLTYQWYRRGNWDEDEEDYIYDPIAGATSAALFIEKLVGFETQYYRCAVTAGEYTKTVELIVEVEQIESDLTLKYDGNISVLYGKEEEIVLKVTATSKSGDPTYQWYIDESGDEDYVTLEGATEAELKLPGNIDVDDYRYRCVVTNETDRDYADFRVNVGMVILSYEDYHSVKYGEDVELTVQAKGVDDELKYQWEVWDEEDGYVYLDGKTNPVLQLKELKKLGETTYKCVVYDSTGGYLDSALINVYVKEDEEALELEYEDEIKVLYGKVSGTVLSVNAETSGTPVYQWYDEEGEPIEGADKAEWTINEELKAGNHKYTCKVSVEGDVDYAYFYVMVGSGLKVDRIWAADDSWYNAKPKEEIKMEVFATSELSDEFTYQWYIYKNDEYRKMPGETGSSITVTAEANNVYYICEVSDGISEASCSFDIYIDSGLTVDILRKVTEAELGTEITLEVKGESKYGNTPTYRWYYEDPDSYDEIDVSEESSYTFVLSESKGYTCEISDGYNTSTIYFPVEVITDLTVKNAPANVVSGTAGEEVKFTIDASTRESYGPVKYMWQEWDNDNWEWNDTGITDASFTKVVADALCRYRCVVSDAHNEEYIEYYVASETVLNGSALLRQDAVGMKIGTNTAVFPDYQTCMWFKFTPEKTGTYKFSSEWLWWYIYIFEGDNIDPINMHSINSECPEITLNAGTEYYLQTYVDQITGNAEINLELLKAAECVWDTGVITKAPTCREDGVKTFTCTDCGETYTEAIPSTGHSFPETWTVTQEATCTEAGIETKECPNCHEVKTQTIPSTGHSFPETWTVTQAATCTEAGIETKECPNCHEVKTQTIPSTGHSFPETWTVTQAATCTEDGIETKECPNCHEVKTQTIPSTGHSFPETWTVMQAATCTKDGSEFRECPGCHGVETQTIQAIGHAYGEVQSAETDSTIREYKICANCKDEVTVTLTVKEEIQDKITEVETAVNALKEGTSTDVSAAVEAVVSVDNSILIELEEVAPEGTDTAMKLITDLEEKLVQENTDITGITGKIAESAVKEKAENASEVLITKDVEVTGAAVTVASVLKEAEGTDKNPDAESTYKAELEIKEDPDAPEEPGVYNIDISLNIIETTKSGETSAYKEDVQPAAPLYITIPVPDMFWGGEFELRHNGVKVNYVRNNNQTISFYAASLSPWSLEMTGCAAGEHNYAEDAEKSTAATCQAAGIRVTVCEICKDEKHEAVSRLAHNTIHVEAKAPTCVVDGNNEYWTCNGCGKYFADAAGKTEITKESTVIAASGSHNWTTVTDQAADCGTAGSQHQECTVCKTKQAATAIPATGKHTWTTVTDRAAGCGTAGSQHQECTVCKTKQAATAIPATGKHTWTTVTDKAAGCGAAGSQHQECTVCKTKQAATAIPATGKHTWKTVTDKAATCGAAGSQYQECTVCKTKQTATAIPATGKHNWETISRTAATCLAAGTRTDRCTVCKKERKDSNDTPKLKGTVKREASKLTLGLDKSVKASRLISGLMEGDYIKSVKSSKSSYVSVKKDKKGNDWTIAGKKVTSKKTGTAAVTITLASGASAKITFSVQKAAVKTSSLKVTNVKSKKATLTVGSKLNLETVVKPVTTSDKLTFSTSNKKIVTVSKSGEITAKKAGTATVTVKSGKKSVKIKVTVKKAAPTSFTLSKTKLSLKVKGSATLKVTFKPSGSEGTVTFKSSNSKVASVSKTGKVTAKKAGTATITATVKSASGKTLKKTCKVTVKK